MGGRCFESAAPPSTRSRRSWETVGPCAGCALGSPCSRSWRFAHVSTLRWIAVQQRSCATPAVPSLVQRHRRGSPTIRSCARCWKQKPRTSAIRDRELDAGCEAGLSLAHRSRRESPCGTSPSAQDRGSRFRSRRSSVSRASGSGAGRRDPARATRVAISDLVPGARGRHRRAVYMGRAPRNAARRPRRVGSGVLRSPRMNQPKIACSSASAARAEPAMPRNHAKNA